MEDKKPQIEQSELPPGLKTRPGVSMDKTKRLPSMSSLMSQIQSGTGSSTVGRAAAGAVGAFTRGGAAKRVFKPKIPAERIKQESNGSTATASNGTANGTKGKAGRVKPERKPGKGKEREMIQIKGTFEGFKLEPKKRDTPVSYGSSKGGGGGGGGRFSVKKESADHTNADGTKSNGDGKDRRRHYESDDEMQVDEEYDSELDSDEDSVEKPICWQPKRATNVVTTTKTAGAPTAPAVKSEPEETAEDVEKRTREELQRGKLVLLPMIFGTSSGDTDYKLQVLRSGRMRLVNKNTGFCIDLINAAPSESTGSVKEVVEVDGDKLIRYGTLSDQDIYAPIRAPN
jgi:hypothetical protein